MDLDISASEQKRLYNMTRYERYLKDKGYKDIAGVDEAGRGPLAGPVVASACILDADFYPEGLDDSKKISAQKRRELYHLLTSSPKVSFSVAYVLAEEIDKTNILKASLYAMEKAVGLLSKKPSFVLVDGNKLPSLDFPASALVKGDSLSLSIAAASVIAKYTRDMLMEKYHQKWPQYDFKSNKGYGTAKHRQALYLYGPCDIHRKTFEPIKSMNLSQ